MRHEARRCGPWRDTWLSRVRRCNNPLLPDEASLEIARRPYVQALTERITAEQAPRPESHPEPQPEPTPPERKQPPAIERVVITDRTNAAARKLIESVFSEEPG